MCACKKNDKYQVWPLIHYPMMEVKEVKKRFTAFSQWQYLCEFWGRHLLFELLFLKFLLRNSNSKCPLMKCSIFPCLFVHLSMWQCDILQYHLFLPLLSHAHSSVRSFSSPPKPQNLTHGHGGRGHGGHGHGGHCGFFWSEFYMYTKRRHICVYSIALAAVHQRCVLAASGKRCWWGGH